MALFLSPILSPHILRDTRFCTNAPRAWKMYRYMDLEILPFVLFLIVMGVFRSSAQDVRAAPGYVWKMNCHVKNASDENKFMWPWLWEI